MTNKIISLAYDKNFVDNTIGNPSALDPTTMPCIKFTARVIDTTTGLPPTKQVQVTWTATRQAVYYFDTNGDPLGSEAVETYTDINSGVAEVYTTCASPAFPTILAEPENDLDEKNNLEGPITKSVVFCTIQDNPSSDYTAPYFKDEPVTMDDEQVYSLTARVDKAKSSTYDDNTIVAWMATRDQDNSVVNRYLLTNSSEKYRTLYTHGFEVPYGYMRTDDVGGDNVMQYLVCDQNGNATLSRLGEFTAIGTAYAMPDPKRIRDPNYPHLIYLNANGEEQDVTELTNDSFYKVNGSFAIQFQIPSHDYIDVDIDAPASDAIGTSAINDDDVLDIYMYLNGYTADDNQLPISKVVYLGNHRFGDIENGTLTIPRSLLGVYAANAEHDPGSVLITYQVNDLAWSPDTEWPTTFTG